MSSLGFVKREVASAIERGVSQCVVIGRSLSLPDVVVNGPIENGLRLFAVDEEQDSQCPAMFVPTQFETEALGAALEKSQFDKLRSALFVWLGGAGYRRLDAVLANLAYIASLPGGSGVVLDYAVERCGMRSMARSALDGLASCVQTASGTLKETIQPQAVAAMLRGLGFRNIVDLDLGADRHLVSAFI